MAVESGLANLNSIWWPDNGCAKGIKANGRCCCPRLYLFYFFFFPLQMQRITRTLGIWGSRVKSQQRSYMKVCLGQQQFKFSLSWPCTAKQSHRRLGPTECSYLGAIHVLSGEQKTHYQGNQPIFIPVSISKFKWRFGTFKILEISLLLILHSWEVGTGMFLT